MSSTDVGDLLAVSCQSPRRRVADMEEHKEEYGMTTQDVDQEVYAQGEARVLTDEMIALAKSRIGVQLAMNQPFNEVATKDALRHFAQGMGNLNPLFYDEEYAKKTRWGGVIAPPFFYRTMGVAEKQQWTAEDRAAARDPLAGIHAFQSGDKSHFLGPIADGDRLTAKRYRADYVEKRSTFSGRMVIQTDRVEYRNQRGELVVIADTQNIRGGRQTRPGERKKYADITRQTYTSEDIHRIDAEYEQEEIRGSTPRYWEDVRIGEEIRPVVKGPYTVTDMFYYKIGVGMATLGAGLDPFPGGAHRLAYEWRKKHPRAYVPNEWGVPEIIERVHWEDAMATHTGNPMAYDWGAQRVTGLGHVLANWVGDDGWVCTVDCQTRRFVYVGDTIYVKGRVVQKYVRDGEHTVDLDVWIEDQRGRIVTPGHAVVLLPSREHGPVTLPPKIDG